MRTLTIDIETLPSDRPEPAEADDRAQFLAESLDGARGRILCISYVNELVRGQVGEGVLGWDDNLGRFDMDERQILQQFWELMTKFNLQDDRLVGHNILGFDLPFIYKRSRILGVRPTRWLSMAKYRSFPVFDTMMEFDCWAWGQRTSLDTLAKAFGLEGKLDGIDGSQVYSLWKEGRHQELRDYALQDVRTARRIYSRMVFEQATIAVAGG